jgi:hypothetical protein
MKKRPTVFARSAELVSICTIIAENTGRALSDTFLQLPGVNYAKTDIEE